MPTLEVAPATEKMLLYNKVREPERVIDMVPKIANNSLLSTGKIANTKYVSIFNEDEVKFYDSNNTVTAMPKQETLKGWRDPDPGLWGVPLTPKVKNKNTETVLASKATTEYLSRRPLLAE